VLALQVKKQLLLVIQKHAAQYVQLGLHALEAANVEALLEPFSSFLQNADFAVFLAAASELADCLPARHCLLLNFADFLLYKSKVFSAQARALRIGQHSRGLAERGLRFDHDTSGLAHRLVLGDGPVQHVGGPVAHEVGGNQDEEALKAADVADKHEDGVHATLLHIHRLCELKAHY